MYYMETASTDPHYNLAFEEYVLKRKSAGESCILWQNEKTVVIGQNQNAEQEINRAYMEKRGIRLARRITGGGAVYHDLGNLNYSFIRKYDDSESFSMRSFGVPLAAALQQLGLDAELSGRNDIVIGDKKVSGTAQRIAGGNILFHGTLLFDSDLEALTRALNADPAKFTGKSTKSIRSRVANIRPMLKTDMDMQAFWDYIKGALLGGAVEPACLTEGELREVEELKQAKYATREWTFGRSPAYTMRVKRKFDGGTLEALLQVEQGYIQDLVFYGDFLSRRPLDDVISLLKGRFFDKQEILAALCACDLFDYFGAITAQELASLLFETPDA